jgi:hypothetical protein
MAGGTGRFRRSGMIISPEADAVQGDGNQRQQQDNRDAFFGEPDAHEDSLVGSQP